MNRDTTTHNAFSLIEVLVALGIIGLLFAIVFASVKSQKDAATAAKTIEQFQVLEAGLRDHFADQEFFSGEIELDLGSNPSITTLMQNGILSDFFHIAPTATFGTAREYLYDNDRVPADSDHFTHTSCTVDATEDEKGVNILLEGVFEFAPRVASEIDRLLDRSDGFGCGRVRRNGATGQYLIYMVSPRYTVI